MAGPSMSITCGFGNEVLRESEETQGEAPFNHCSALKETSFITETKLLCAQAC